MERLFLIMLMGALGTGTRYLIGLWVAKRLQTTFPYATLIVNLIGCFFIALIFELALRRTNFSPTLKLALTTGYLGGLTTYSSFNYESTRLLEAGATGIALANISATLIGCFLAGLLGSAVARLVPA
ncbi:MAG: fluoride efflux transporter CrcB [Myxococcota bacterium]